MQEQTIYTLHGAASSPFVRKTWLFLHEKNLRFEHRQLDPLNKTERFLSMNPLGRIPVLETQDGQFVSDSSVICDFLEHTHPQPPLYPSEPLDRARALWLEEYADTALATVCARIFWMYILLPVRTGSPVDPNEVATFQAEEYPGVFDYLERIAPDSAGIVGDAFSIADIALASPVKLLDLAGAPLDATRWPRFERYYRRTIARPSARSIEAEDLATTEVWRTTGNAPT
ncbi:MAG: glutathione S-transferase family protein [Pseudomonadales bacterium]